MIKCSPWVCITVPLYCHWVFWGGPDTYVPAQSRTARRGRHKRKGAEQWKCGEAARRGWPSPIKHVLSPMADFWVRAPRHVTCYLSQKKKATWLERNRPTLRHKLSEVIVISLVRDFTSRSPHWVAGISKQSAVGNGETRNGNWLTKWSPILYRAILFQEMIPWNGFAAKALFVPTVSKGERKNWWCKLTKLRWIPRPIPLDVEFACVSSYFLSPGRHYTKTRGFDRREQNSGWKYGVNNVIEGSV